MTHHERRYWALLSLETFAVSFSCSIVLEKVQPGFLTTCGFYGIYGPFPQQLALHSQPLLPLARISRRGKQTICEETNTTVNNYVKKQKECLLWERMSFFLHFPIISWFPLCPTHPLLTASGTLWGDHLRARAAWDRWADDGSDVIDSRVMDGWLADRGLM